MFRFCSAPKEAMWIWELCLVEGLTHRVCRKRSLKFSLKADVLTWLSLISHPAIHFPCSWYGYLSKSKSDYVIHLFKALYWRNLVPEPGRPGLPWAGPATSALVICSWALGSSSWLPGHLSHWLLLNILQPRMHGLCPSLLGVDYFPLCTHNPPTSLFFQAILNHLYTQSLFPLRPLALTISV